MNKGIILIEILFRQIVFVCESLRHVDIGINEFLFFKR